MPGPAMTWLNPSARTPPSGVSGRGVKGSGSPYAIFSMCTRGRSLAKHLMLALALVTALPAIAAEPERRPYSCQLFDAEQRDLGSGGRTYRVRGNDV
jgi:hypothetical protein